MKEHYIKKFSDGTIAFISVINDKIYRKHNPESEFTIKGTLVSRVEVPLQHRQKGIATELLKKVIADADKECEELTIEPSPDNGTQESYNKLTKFYSKFGFEPSEHFQMKRKPKCLKDSM